MGAGAAAGALLLPVLPESARAAALVDPYGGSIPLVFPLAYGTYRSPVQDNWHANREGQTYAWNHRNGLSQRAHDGVDIYPSRRSKLPRVYAPLATLAWIAGWTERLRHMAYAGGWKKFEPMWDWIIRAKRATQMLPALESILAGFGTHQPQQSKPAADTRSADLASETT